MYLGKRKNGNYFIEFYDEVESRIRRITTKTKIRKEAIKFLSDFLTIRLFTKYPK